MAGNMVGYTKKSRYGCGRHAHVNKPLMKTRVMKHGSHAMVNKHVAEYIRKKNEK